MANPFNTSVGQLTGTGAEVTVTLGYQPCYIRILEATNGNIWEKHGGLPTTLAIKYEAVGPTITFPNIGDIIINSNGFTISANVSVLAAPVYYTAIRGET